MVAHSEMVQRIARLTPLAEVVAMLEAAAQPVAAQRIALPAAFGLTLAENACAAGPKPATAIALRDGWAVRAELISDASAYAPAMLPQPPRWVEVGDRVMADADSVAPLDAVVIRSKQAEAVAAIAPGESVLAAAADATASATLKPAGARLRRTDVAVLAAAGIDQVVVRAPRILISRAGKASVVIDAAVELVAAAVASSGGVPLLQPEQSPDRLDRALADETADAVMIVGGTGSGRRDDSVRALTRNGQVGVHGIAISPGETAGFGAAGGRPVLLLPGRIDAALSVWLLLGRSLLARLSGGRLDEAANEAALSRKVASRLGFTEVVLVRRTHDGVEPLASDYLSLTALAQADGWVLVPPVSEGFAPGSIVSVRPLP